MGMAPRLCYLPAKFSIDCSVGGNRIRQLRFPAIETEAEVVPYVRGRQRGELLTLGVRNVTVLPKRVLGGGESLGEVLITPDGRAPHSSDSQMRWFSPSMECLTVYDRQKLLSATSAVSRSWKGQFSFAEEEPLANGDTKPGLRPPQIGGLHAAIAHWKMSDGVATIVMPTGTGKTETMVAVTVHERPARVLVVVPSDPLRGQITEKFLTLGLLRELGVCGNAAQYPVVGTLRQGIAASHRLRDFIEGCNVVISTMSLLSRLSDADQRMCAGAFSHLFIDEAHHIKARTWERFRDVFQGRRILQFTATPFRNDGAHVDGRVLFNYPLLKAQTEGYFKQINLLPVVEFDPDLADQAIANAAVAQLGKDIAAGFDHVIMARTSTIAKAATLINVYEQCGTQFHPVLIHSEIAEQVRQTRLEQLKKRQSRIVVCVDMFGEGFDFPELKIAALHQVHKSLAITLQFTGRFTRTKNTIGDATIVVNTYDPGVDAALQELYAEDANWNQILRRLSEGATGKQVEKQEFIESFALDSENIPVQNLTPKMSSVVYKTHCQNWQPRNLLNLIPKERLVGTPSINSVKNVAYFVLLEEGEVEWGKVKGFVNRAFDLYVLFWDAQRRLLFINTSNNDASHEAIAKAVAGDSVELIKGSAVFRVFGGLHRLLLQTLGLSHTISRVIRFTMHVGADVPAGLAEAQTQNKIKTNIFGSGFSDGERLTIGCSRKGRIWSRQTAPDLLAWIEWCRHVGLKLQNRTFSEDEILRNSIIPTDIETRPDLMPLAIEWPDSFYVRNEDATHLYFADKQYDFEEIGLELVDPDLAKPIRFRVFAVDQSATYEIQFSKTGASYTAVSNGIVSIGVGRRKKPLAEWFRQEPPIIRFENDSFTKDNQLCKPFQARLSPFDAGKIDAWTWDNVDLRRESQTSAKLSDSIQYRLIQRLKDRTWPETYDVIFDDDDTREAADVVALRIKNDELLVHLFHCKFSGGDTAGARVKDLYEVCGQAQKSVQWRAHLDHLFSHLIRRDVDYFKRLNASRFEVGNRKTVFRMRKQAPYLKTKCAVYIVQPGLSKQWISGKQLELLGATELFLIDQYEIRLHVIASP
jgi:superfamily II DNA or RNA helicase